jgi:nucleoid-associated protein Lsr2
MAQKTVIQLTDDVDGARINGSGETVPFALDGVDYEIDLSEKNARKLRELFEPYIAVARRRGSGSRASRSASTGARARDTHGIREWARQNGHEISERGRISTTVLAAYEAATTQS